MVRWGLAKLRGQPSNEKYEDWAMAQLNLTEPYFENGDSFLVDLFVCSSFEKGLERIIKSKKIDVLFTDLNYEQDSSLNEYGVQTQWIAGTFNLAFTIAKRNVRKVLAFTGYLGDEIRKIEESAFYKFANDLHKEIVGREILRLEKGLVKRDFAKTCHDSIKEVRKGYYRDIPQDEISKFRELLTDLLEEINNIENNKWNYTENSRKSIINKIQDILDMKFSIGPEEQTDIIHFYPFEIGRFSNKVLDFLDDVEGFFCKSRNSRGEFRHFNNFMSGKAYDFKEVMGFWQNTTVILLAEVLQELDLSTQIAGFFRGRFYKLTHVEFDALNKEETKRDLSELRIQLAPMLQKIFKNNEKQQEILGSIDSFVGQCNKEACKNFRSNLKISLRYDVPNSEFTGKYGFIETEKQIRLNLPKEVFCENIIANLVSDYFKGNGNLRGKLWCEFKGYIPQTSNLLLWKEGYFIADKFLGGTLRILQDISTYCKEMYIGSFDNQNNTWTLDVKKGEKKSNMIEFIRHKIDTISGDIPFVFAHLRFGF